MSRALQDFLRDEERAGTIIYGGIAAAMLALFVIAVVAILAIA